MKEIAANFDPELFNHVRVTLPNGNGIYHICDGQHGKAAVEMIWGPEEKVPCLIAPERDPSQAAELFIRMNTSQRPPTKIDHFKVYCHSMERMSQRLTAFPRQHGWHVDYPSKPSHQAVNWGTKVCLPFGTERVLDRTLHYLDEIWTDDPAAVGGALLRGQRARSATSKKDYLERRPMSSRSPINGDPERSSATPRRCADRVGCRPPRPSVRSADAGLQSLARDPTGALKRKKSKVRCRGSMTARR